MEFWLNEAAPSTVNRMTLELPTVYLVEHPPAVRRPLKYYTLITKSIRAPVQ